jgi:hypothetical protein
MFDLTLNTAQPRLHDRVLRLYRNIMLMGWFARLGAALLQRTRTLRTLAEHARGEGRYVGIQAVAIAQIVGSEGRVHDFDANFAPLREHTRDRWVRVALARVTNIALPPVQLIHAADGYYVRDGHHRISVARAFGEAYIEAEVIRY